MLNLPKSTEVNKVLPKKAIYASANLDSTTKNTFDENIKKLTIVNEVLANNVNIEASNEVTGFYVLAVQLKKQDYDLKVVEKLFKMVNQRLVIVLQFEDVAQLAVHHNKLFTSNWQPVEELQLKLQGLNFAQVWQNIILQIGNFQLEQGNTLEKQLAINDERSKLQKQIDALKKKAWAEKQPKKKFAYAQELKVLERQLEEL